MNSKKKGRLRFLIPLILRILLGFAAVSWIAAAAEADVDTANSIIVSGQWWDLVGDYEGTRSSETAAAEYDGDFENAAAAGSIAYRRWNGSRFDSGKGDCLWLDDMFRRRNCYGLALTYGEEQLEDARGTGSGDAGSWRGSDDRRFRTLALDGQARIFLTNRLAFRPGLTLEREFALFDIERESQQVSYCMRNREKSEITRGCSTVDLGMDLLFGDRTLLSFKAFLAGKREAWEGKGSLVAPGFIEGESYELTAEYTGTDVGAAVGAVAVMADEHLALQAGLSISRQVMKGRSLSEFSSGPKIPGDFNQSLDLLSFEIALNVLPANYWRAGVFATALRWNMSRREQLSTGAEPWLFNEDWDGVDAQAGLSGALEISRSTTFFLKTGYRKRIWDRIEDETFFDKSAEGDHDGPLIAFGVESRF